MEKSFEGDENENLTGKKVHLDWDEIRKGVLGSGEEKNPTNNTPLESATIKNKEEDSLEGEEFSRPSSLPEIVIDLNEENTGTPNQSELSENLTGKREKFNWEKIMTGPLENKKSEEEAEKDYWAEIQKRALKETGDKKDETPPPKPAPIKPEDPELNSGDAEKLRKEKEERAQKEKEERERLEELKRIKEEEEKLREEKKKRLDEIVTAINEKKQKIEQFSTLDSLRAAKREEKEKLLKELEELEKERREIEKELGITSEDPPKKESSWLERQREKISTFLRIKKEENETEAENLSLEKKRLREKLIALAKNRKVQAAVVGSALLGISIAVPPVGGAAWLSFGFVPGFLPVELGIPLKVLGGAASGAILKKVIEAKRAKEQKKSGEVKMNKNEHFEYSEGVEEQQKKVFEAFGAVKMAQENLESIQNSPDSEEKAEKIKEAQSELDKASLKYLEEYNILTKMIYESIKKESISDDLKDKEEKKTPEKLLNEKEKIALNSADSLEKLYEAIKQIEGDDNATKVIDDIEKIRGVMNDPRFSTKSEKNTAIDSLTGKNDLKVEGVTSPEIPEIYNNKINELLKKEIAAIPDTKLIATKEPDDRSENKKEQGENNEGSNGEKKEEGIPETNFKANTINDFCNEIEASGVENSTAIVETIHAIVRKKIRGENIAPEVVKLPDVYKPKLTILLKNAPVFSSEKLHEDNGVKSFTELLKSPDLTPDQIDAIKKIRIGQESATKLSDSLEEAVSKLIERETKRIEKSTTLKELYANLREVCNAVGSDNGFGVVSITDSMKKYLNPDPNTSRKEALEQIPEIYGIRKKFLQTVADEDLARGLNSDEPAIDRTAIQNNPGILIEEKRSTSERIQEIVMKKIEDKLEKASSIEDIADICSEIPDSAGVDVSALKENLEDVEVYASTDSENSKKLLDNTLNDIPEEYGIREAVSRIVKK